MNNRAKSMNLTYLLPMTPDSYRHPSARASGPRCVWGTREGIGASVVPVPPKAETGVIGVPTRAWADNHIGMLHISFLLTCLCELVFCIYCRIQQQCTLFPTLRLFNPAVADSFVTSCQQYIMIKSAIQPRSTHPSQWRISSVACRSW